VRAHQLLPDPEQCLLDQGLVCMGIATRGGCGARCVQVNMACRGCYGPLPRMLDPAAELVSALAALPGPRGEWEMPLHQVVGPARQVKDPLGTFYRFTYPVSMGRRTVTDKAED
jgi:F420-non-reducing hydrogenase small subunit